MSDQGISVGLVGTIEHPLTGRSTEPQLDTLVHAILRESAVDAPNVRDEMLIAFARVSRYGQLGERSSRSSEEDIGETVGDRILVTAGTQFIYRKNLTTFAARHSPIESEVIVFGVYGRIGQGSSAERESLLERRGIQLAEQGRYAEARSLFERVLPMRAEPLFRAQVLRNIMLTHIREGDEARAMETGKDILKIFALTETIKGCELHGEIVGRFKRSDFR